MREVEAVITEVGEWENAESWKARKIQFEEWRFNDTTCHRQVK